jgi:hypothetical protein
MLTNFKEAWPSTLVTFEDANNKVMTLPRFRAVTKGGVWISEYIF